jgi:hypothetical protein
VLWTASFRYAVRVFSRFLRFTFFSPSCFASFSPLVASEFVARKFLWGGGWISSPFRPPSLGEEWPLPGRSSVSAPMDSKNRNPNWDRWGPKEVPQGSQSWGKNRNLSWRLKTGSRKPDIKEDIPVSTPGDAGQPGILKTPPPPILKSENDLVRRVFARNVVWTVIMLGSALSLCGARSVAKKPTTLLGVFFPNRISPVCRLLV